MTVPPSSVDAWKAAIARIDVSDGKGGQAHGTGALVTERLVLTALHVVGNRQANPPAFYDDGGQVVLRFGAHTTRGRVVRDSISFSPTLDFALVECEVPPPGVRPLPLRDVTAAGVEARWASFGFPLAATQTGGGIVVEGNISDARGEYQGAEALQLYSQQAAAGDGAPVPGLSGGPVIVDGALVGVLRSSLMAEGGRNVAGTLFACPARVIAERCATLLPPLETYPGLPGVAIGDLPEEPFRYLSWYREQEAELFFGRNRELAEMFQRVVDPDEAPLLLLYGQSGVGKSSFLAAGLLPRLKRTHQVHYVRRDKDAGLLGSVVRVLLAMNGDAGQAASDVGGKGAAADVQVLARAWRQIEQQTGRPLVLIADQVEEVYSRPSDRDDELGEFLGAAATLFRERATRPRGRLVLSFRKEWHAELVTHVRGAGLPHSEVFLRGIDRAGIVEVVRALVDQPRLRKRYGLTLEDGLAEDIASDLREDKGSPIAPTLQVLLTKLWKAATAVNRRAPRFDRELYEQLKRGDLLREFLREQLAVVDKAHHDAVTSGLVLDVLGQHVTDADTAGQRTLAELQSAYTHLGAAVPALVGDLKSVYLLVDSSEDRADHADATRLAHDTLAPHVRRALNSSQARGQRARRILDNRGVEWQAGTTGATLDEADLKRVEQGRDGTRTFTADEERLVQASLGERRARRRRSWIAAGVAGALGLVALGAVIATVRFWRSGQDARRQNQAEQANTRRAEAEARLRATAAFAEKQLATDQLATLTVVAAIDQSRVDLGRVLPALNRALAQVVQEARQIPVARNREELPPGLSMPADGPAEEGAPRRPVEGVLVEGSSDDPATAADPHWIPDLAIAGQVLFSPLGKELRRWELAPAKPPRALDPVNVGAPVSAIASAPKGDRVATGDVHGNVSMRGPDGSAISVTRPSGVGRPIRVDAVTALAFSPDGDHLAVGDRGGGVYVLSLRDGSVETAIRRGGLGRKPRTRGAGGPGSYGSPQQEPDEPVAVNAVAVFADPALALTVAAASSDALAVWNRTPKGWRKHGEGFIDASRSVGFTAIEPMSVESERVLVSAERSGTVRAWLFAEREGGPLSNRVVSASSEALGDLARDTPFVIRDRIVVLKAGGRLRSSSLGGGLIEEHGVRGVGALGLSADKRWAAYANQDWLGLIDQTGLQVAAPFAVRYLAHSAFPSDRPSVVFSLASAQAPGRIAACNGRNVWVLDLDPRYPATARSLANDDGDHRVGVGVVGGKEVLVHWGETDANASGHHVLVTDWAGTRIGEIPSEIPEPSVDSAEVRTWFDVRGDVAVRGNAAGVTEVFDLAHGKSVANYGNRELVRTLGVGVPYPGQHLVTVVRDGLVNSLDWAGQWMGIYGCPDPTDCNVSPPSWRYKLLAQSFDGKTLAATAPDEVDVWFQATGRGPRARSDLNIGQTGEVSTLALSPDGSVIALAGEKGISLYDRSGQLFGELPAGSQVDALAFEPSGQLLASVDRANTLRLWRVNPDDWLKVACRRLAMSSRWAAADTHAKRACASVHSKAMASERIAPSAGE